MPVLFVYGSLKEGFPNFHVNKGRRVPGGFRTAQPFPFYLVGGGLPCLLPTPGTGHQVAGQLFEVTPAQLAVMDALERVGEPGGYQRIAIDIEATDASPEPLREAWVYVQQAERLDAPGELIGPLAEYTLEHAKTLRW